MIVVCSVVKLHNSLHSQWIMCDKRWYLQLLCLCSLFLACFSQGIERSAKNVALKRSSKVCELRAFNHRHFYTKTNLCTLFSVF